jgi:hypothetical protein
LAKTAAAQLWKFVMLEDIGHDIETEDADDLLDELVNFVDHISPSQYKKEKIKRSSSVPGKALGESFLIPCSSIFCLTGQSCHAMAK